jgi:hypothetical protein
MADTINEVPMQLFMSTKYMTLFILNAASNLCPADTDFNVYIGRGEYTS